jgi:uncharacterized protein (DUF4415 family)
MSDNAMKKPSHTDWEQLAGMDDEDIDQSDLPALTHTFFEHARVYLPRQGAETLVQLDEDVAAWFKAHEKEYKLLINDILRSYIATHDK